MTDEDKALVERLRLGHEGPAAARIKAQAAEIEYWKTEARNVRRELKSEQKQTDSAMDNYDAMQRRCEAQAAEIEKLRMHLDVALETLAEEGVCGDECNSCKEARAALGEAK